MKFAVLATVALSLVVQCLAQTSQNPPSLDEFANYEASHMFPNNASNANCVKAGCPALSNSDLCPYLKGNLDCAIANQTMSILNTCLATKNSVCNIPFDPIALAPTTYGFRLNLIVLDVYLSCAVNPNTVFFTNLSQSVYSMAKDQCMSDGCLQINVTNPNAYYYGSSNCEIDINSTVIPIFKNGLKLGPFNFPFTTNLPFSITSVVCSNDKSPAPVVKITIKEATFLNFDISFMAGLYAFEDIYISNSQIGRSLAAFMNSFANSAIEAARQNCR